MKKTITTLLLSAAAIICKAQTILLQETFSNGTMPVGWYNDSAGQVPVIGWKFTGQPSVPAGNGFDNNYVRISDNGAAIFDCYLVTPSIDASTVNKLFLTFSDRMLFATGNNYSVGYIEVSIDGGSNWFQILEARDDHYPVKRNVIDVSAIVVGSSNVKFRYHYHALGSAGGWAIDSVVVTDSVPCTSPPDSGFAVSNQEFVCTGSSAKLWLDDLARGIGQTYQWQLKNAVSGNVWSNITGATTDTLNTTQNGSTYYRCEVTCGGLSTNSVQLLLPDTPSGTDTYSDNIHLCAGRDDTLRIVSPYDGSGIGYQWQWSAAGNGTYVDIAGANNDTYIVGISNYTSSTYFKCKQVCLSNNTAKAGFWVNEVPNPHTMCYCYPWNNNPCGNNYYISNLQINGTTLNNNTTCIDTLVVHWNNNNYQFFDPALGNTTATLIGGQTYMFNITSTNAQQYAGLWIDYNFDNTFEVNEYLNLGIIPFNGTANVQFTVPSATITGLTGMRLRTRKFYPVDSTNACGNIVGGTTHDYIVTIDSTVSVNNLVLNENGITLYPNPASDKLTVTSNQTITTAKLLTVTGSVVIEQANVNGVKVVFDVSTLPAGIYFAEVVTDKGRVARKWVKD